MNQYDDIPPIAAFIRGVREAQHLTQAEVARRSRLTRAYINALEAGAVKEPSGRTLALLAQALDIDIRELLEGSGAVAPRQQLSGITSEDELTAHLREACGLSDGSIREIVRLIRLFELSERSGA